MLANFFRITLRRLLRQKLYSSINVVGLAIGMACTILIFLWIQHEMSFDKFHENADNIYGVYTEYDDGKLNNSSIPYPVGPALLEKFPKVINYTRLRFRSGIIKYGTNIYNEDRFCRADPSIFEIFSFPFLKGNPQTALSEPFSAVISEETAIKYFGKEDPIGKIITYNNNRDFKITGVIKKIPTNSHLQFNFLVSYPINSGLGVVTGNPWGTAHCLTYVLLQKNILIHEFEQRITGLINDYDPSYETFIKLKALNKIHLDPIYESNGHIIYSNKFHVYIFSFIALFILLIACINFMNLSTARYMERSKEVGLRKAIGAKRTQIIKQFFGESILLIFISLIITLILMELILPFYNNFTTQNIVTNYSNYKFIIGLICVGVITGIIAGSYPALFLSSFKPINILKGKISSTSKGAAFRNILVVIQFSISIILIVCTSIIYSQLNFIYSKNIGFNKENLICLRLNRDIRDNYESVRNVLSTNSGVLSYTTSRTLPSSIYLDAGELDWEGRKTDKKVRFTFSVIDFNYIETLQMEIVQGRNFSRKFSTDESNYILNEEAIKQMELNSPLGKRFNMWGFQGKIIGIIKNFHYNHLDTEIEPLVLTLHNFGYSYLIIRSRPENIQHTIKSLENIWTKYSPEYPFEYFFLNDDYYSMYSNEQKTAIILKYFAALAICISCFGLFGLASFTTEQRTKEIGIRKVLGAPVYGIITLLSKEFVRWVLIANLIAWPISYYIMNRWLQNFAYRIEIGLWTFLLAGTLALVIALLTVSFQAIRAASRNPVEALKYE